MDKDIIVIGGGPGGYTAAIRAARLGGKVTLVEKDGMGGTCLNRGCIPTKFMLRAVETYQAFKSAGHYGIKVGEAHLDPASMQMEKRKVVSSLSNGIKGLMSVNGVELINGEAKLLTANQVEVTKPDGSKETISAKNLIIATGAKPMVLSVPGAVSPSVLKADDLLNMEQVPDSLIIIGGGVVGVEMATVYASLGCQVSLVEMMPHCLPAQDDEIAAVFEGILRDNGIQVRCGTRVSRIEDTADGKAVVLSCDGKEESITAQAVAVAIGYCPYSNGLGMEEIGVATDRGRIIVDDKMQTNVPGIYAAGDVVGGMMLAYIAIAEGIVAAENAMGAGTSIDYNAVPQCIFTLPEMACVGLNEQEALAQGFEIEIGRFPFWANGMAAVIGEPRGMVKIIVDRKNRQVLGAHIIGPEATLLIAELVSAVKQEMTVDDFISIIHAHPSLTEAVWEAAADVKGQAIHIPPRKR